MSFIQTKLQKLTIHAFNDPLRSQRSRVGTFTAMYNPESFSQRYGIQYGKKQSLNSTNKQALYSYSEPRELAFKLILDGTGVHEMGLLKRKPQASVDEKVEHFLKLTFDMNGDIHAPNYLIAEWGGEETGFDCRLLNVNVTYTSFNRDGSTLRAELDIVLISDEEVTKRLAEENKNSPDLTHYRVVKEGDTLPLLTKEIYGTPKYYLQIAQINNLDNFRQLTPGTELFFPPLER